MAPKRKVGDEAPEEPPAPKSSKSKAKGGCWQTEIDRNCWPVGGVEFELKRRAVDPLLVQRYKYCAEISGPTSHARSNSHPSMARNRSYRSRGAHTLSLFAFAFHFSPATQLSHLLSSLFFDMCHVTFGTVACPLALLVSLSSTEFKRPRCARAAAAHAGAIGV